MVEPIARIIINESEREVHTGEDALIVAQAMASVYQDDFPDAIVAVAHNTEAAVAKERIITESLKIVEAPD